MFQLLISHGRWLRPLSFLCGPPFGLFWFVKYLNLEQKLPIQSRHPEVNKNPCYVFSTKGSQKKVSAHGLYFPELLMKLLMLHILGCQ